MIQESTTEISTIELALQGLERGEEEGTHLIDADFCLHVLQALLDDADEGSRGNQSTIDVGLADVTLYAKRERWVGEPCRGDGGWQQHALPHDHISLWCNLIRRSANYSQGAALGLSTVLRVKGASMIPSRTGIVLWEWRQF